MSKAKRTPRLGKGLSSLVGRPVRVTPPGSPAPGSPGIASNPGSPGFTESPSPAEAADAAKSASSTQKDGRQATTSATAVSATTSATKSSAGGSGTAIAPPVARMAGTPAAGATPQASEKAMTPSKATDQPSIADDINDGLHYLPVTAIRPNPHQPRQQFDEAALARLAASIRREGVMQPIVVRPVAGQSGRFELVAGERRWRAAQLATLEQIPAMVRELDEKQIAEWALIENLQREDLNAIERALAFQHLIDQFHLSHEQVAEQVGIDRSSVSNSLRLLSLCESVRAYVRDNLLSGGQAKALAGVSDAKVQLALADRAIKEAWSVRRLEAEVRAAAADSSATASTSAPAGKAGSAWAAHLADLESQLGQQLGSKVKIRPGRKKGTGAMTIEFFSVDHFDELLGRLGVSTD